MRFLNINFSFKSFMATVDAILIIVERCFEFKLLAEYYMCGDSAWLRLTAVSMLLPGTVGTVLWAAQAWKKRIVEDLSLKFVFGVGLSVIVWPISSVIWYVIQRHYFCLSVLNCSSTSPGQCLWLAIV